MRLLILFDGCSHNIAVRSNGGWLFTGWPQFKDGWPRNAGSLKMAGPGMLSRGIDIQDSLA